ncbi:MAG: hypothetical protein H6631_08985 [Anaerolineaceae bacterium]|nr:hypothetical protein [Anaerolineaceae bacterium]
MTNLSPIPSNPLIKRERQTAARLEAGRKIVAQQLDFAGQSSAPTGWLMVQVEIAPAFGHPKTGRYSQPRPAIIARRPIRFDDEISLRCYRLTQPLHKQRHLVRSIHHSSSVIRHS